MPFLKFQSWDLDSEWEILGKKIKVKNIVFNFSLFKTSVKYHFDDTIW